MESEIHDTVIRDLRWQHLQIISVEQSPVLQSYDTLSLINLYYLYLNLGISVQYLPRLDCSMTKLLITAIALRINPHQLIYMSGQIFVQTNFLSL